MCESVKDLGSKIASQLGERNGAEEYHTAGLVIHHPDRNEDLTMGFTTTDRLEENLSKRFSCHDGDHSFTLKSVS